MKTDPSFLRSRVWKRDKGRCSRCGLKCRELEKGIALLRDVLARQGKSKVYAEIRKALKIQSRHTFWDADHIRAVVDGGGECGLENMQTLCLWCHREKTTGRTKTENRKTKIGEEGPALQESALALRIAAD